MQKGRRSQAILIMATGKGTAHDRFQAVSLEMTYCCMLTLDPATPSAGAFQAAMRFVTVAATWVDKLHQNRPLACCSAAIYDAAIGDAPVLLCCS